MFKKRKPLIEILLLGNLVVVNSWAMENTNSVGCPFIASKSYQEAHLSFKQKKDIQRDNEQSQSSKIEVQKSYEQIVSELQQKYAGHTSLYKHVAYFVNRHGEIDSQSVIDKLEEMHESKLEASIKGVAIKNFNVNFVGGYSEREKYKPTEENVKALHHDGTTRIYDYETGNINETEWNNLLAYTIQGSDGKKIMPQSQLLKYLEICFENDPRTHDPNYGYERAKLEAEGAKQAWLENYRLLAEGWIKGPDGKYEPYITVDGLRLFFEDTPLAFAKTVAGLLPVPSPE